MKKRKMGGDQEEQTGGEVVGGEGDKEEQEKDDEEVTGGPNTSGLSNGQQGGDSSTSAPEEASKEPQKSFSDLVITHIHTRIAPGRFYLLTDVGYRVSCHPYVKPAQTSTTNTQLPSKLNASLLLSMAGT